LAWDLFTTSAVVATALVVGPLTYLFLTGFSTVEVAWDHIKEHLLLDYITNSLILLTLTGILATLLGFLSAYLVTFYDFGFRRWLKWMMILPLAIPSYIVAYAYGDLFSYTGHISRLLRWMGYGGTIDVMSMGGAAVVFAFTLYPYIYLPLRSVMEKHTMLYMENATLLQPSRWRAVWNVLLPLTRPALVGGLILVLLETLNDYGVVRYFGVRVFSFAIFDAWFRLRDLASAVRISAITLIVVFTLISGEKLLRGRRSYQLAGRSLVRRRRPSKLGRIVIPVFLVGTLGIGFLIPVAFLLYNLFLTYEILLDVSFVYLTINTLTIAVTVTLVILVVAVLLANVGRLHRGWWKKALIRITTIGYAIPGAVIAVAVLVTFVDLDRTLVPLYRWWNPHSPTLVLSGSLWMLGFAYVFRFQTIGMNLIEASYDKLGLSYTEASHTLGKSRIKTLIQVDLPMLKEGLIAAFIIVFIDVMKELPLTLILRPTNYDTLATKVYTYASDEMIHEASGPALMIVLLCLIAIYVLTHRKGGRHVRSN
jgi:iron(III) transport system permease protein